MVELDFIATWFLILQAMRLHLLAPQYLETLVVTSLLD